MTSDSSKPLLQTETLQHWRSVELNQSLRLTVEHVGACGWEATHISADPATPRVTYSTGAFDVHGVPEIIVIGLREDTAHGAIDIAIGLMRSGVDLTEGRHREIVGEVEVEFRLIDSKWLHHVMRRADWYYQRRDVPVLQLVYPDLENHFQWDTNFAEYYRQPLLMPDAPETQQEQDLWKAFDPDSSFYAWSFPDPPHTQVFLSRTVQAKEEAVTYVSHDADDGSWQFLGYKMAAGGGPVLSCLHHPIDEDRSLMELGDLPRGWCASRNAPGQPWERYEHRPDVDETETPVPR